MSYFPLFHNTQNLKALIVGGGKIAQRRTNSLLDAGVACDILATAVVEPLRTLVESAGGTVTIDAYTNDEVMLGYGLILAVTDDRAVNQTIAQHAKAMGLLINVADAPDDGADIDGYIKKTNNSKSTLTGDFLFKKKDKKESVEKEERPEVVNKEAIA